MALKVGGTEVVDNNRQLKNIASIDSGTVTAFNSALNTDPTKGTLTKTFAENETADITLSSNVSVGPVVSATKEVPQTGISTKGNWDVNSTASNYDFHNTATNVTLTPSTTTVIGDISGASYDSAYFSVASQQGDPQGCTFGDNGTKLYVAGKVPQGVHQYNLTTAYDISTASYASKFLDTSTQSIHTRTVKFKSDGTVVYVLDDQNYRVLYYNLSTAWDLSTASSVPSAFSVGAQGRGLAFKPDGTKMYHLQPSNIKEYTLSTAWDLSTASNTHTASGFSGRDITLNSTGTRLYVLNGNVIQDHTLSTAYDLSTVSSVVSNFNISSQSGDAQGIVFNGDDSKIFLLEKTNDYLYQYTTGTSTTNTLALGSGSFASTDVGKRIVGNGGDVILTATSGTFDTTGGSAFTDNSTIAAGSWSMFGLKSAGDASGITISGKALSGNYTLLDTTDGHTHKVTLGSTHASGHQGFTIDPNGLYLFAVDSTNDRVKRYDFGTPWDLSTLNLTAVSGQVSTSSYDGGPVDIAFNPSGTKLYVAGQDSDYVYQWNLSTAWDLGTGVYTGSLNVQASNRVAGGFNGIFVTPDGTKLYTICRNTDRVARWNFDSSQNVANASFDSAHWVGGVNSYPYDIAWNPDGSAMYLSGNNSGFYKWNATTAFEISSGFVNDSSFSVTVNTNAVEGFFIKPDETKIYTMYNNEISQWDIGEFTQPNNQYHVAVTNSGGQIDSQYFTDINSMTAAESAGTGTAHYAVSTDGRTTWSVAKGTDGVRPIVRNNSGTWQYNSENSTTTTTDAISSSTLTDTIDFRNSASYATSNNIRTFFNNDGTRLYVYGYNSRDLVSYALSTAYDMSTKGTHLQSVNLGSSPYSLGYSFGPIWNNDGTKLYYPSHSGTNKIEEFTLSTAYDLSTIPSTPSHTYTPQNWTSQMAGLVFKPDGTKMYAVEDGGQGSGGGGQIHTFTLSTAWDLSTASFTSKTADNYFTHSGARFTSFEFADSGSTIYILDRMNDVIRRYSLATAWDVTNATYLGTSYDIALTGGSSNDPCSITIDNNDSVLLVSDYGSQETFEYRPATITTTAYNTTPVWTNGTVNDELYTLQQALSVTMNRMDKTQLDAVADANHFTLGNSLDLMIALYQDTANASSLPKSDGVTLNYDGAVLNEGAILGTDYDFFHPAANKVQIKSLAAQNLKVRVV